MQKALPANNEAASPQQLRNSIREHFGEWPEDVKEEIMKVAFDACAHIDFKDCPDMANDLLFFFRRAKALMDAAIEKPEA